MRLALIVQTGAVVKNILRQVEDIQVVDIHHQAHGYFGLTGIGNVFNHLRNTFVVSYVLNLDTNVTQMGFTG